jgi:hypothetical protein
MDTQTGTKTKTDVSSIKVTRYKKTRYWAIWLDDELLAVTVYKKGAIAIKLLLADMGYSSVLESH